MAADGSIYVAFENYAAAATDPTGNDQYLAVKVDPQTGARIAGPYDVAVLADSANAYPTNIDGRETYQDSQFRTWSAGNIAVDPTDPLHMAVIWSDMRNSTPNTSTSDPDQWITNSDVVVSQSFDGGQNWSSPTALAIGGDQFMPWGVYDSTGILRIGFFDRSYDSENHAYGYTLADRDRPGHAQLQRHAADNRTHRPDAGGRAGSPGPPRTPTTLTRPRSWVTTAASPPRPAVASSPFGPTAGTRSTSVAGADLARTPYFAAAP